MPIRTRLTISIAAGLALAVAGCGGAAVSPQLADARDAMQQARSGLAGELEPDQLREAERILERAEAASDGSEREQHHAYLADRRIRVAMADAERQHVQNQLEQEQEQYRAQLEETTIERNRALEDRRESLRDIRGQLEEVREELDERGDTLDARTEELRAREQELARREAELVAEREARREAERRAAAAMSRLRELAEVREEQNDTIITLSGEVLFRTGEHELRPNSRQRLTAVADALKAQPDRRVVVEGHTDARGSDADNRELSRERADAVRAFLVERGVESDRVEAVGRGESEPVADNDTPTGRANNRRVEIILHGTGGDETAGRPASTDSRLSQR
ncbi:MAG TPA: OmpA family protein [Sandaracinaceae bacterium LLY-WYZ-13_1]|nr:OmpA family protein [Sandaracinaceae bacterium LLY-WYZ-13_1]